MIVYSYDLFAEYFIDSLGRNYPLITSGSWKFILLMAGWDIMPYKNNLRIFLHNVFEKQHF